MNRFKKIFCFSVLLGMVGDAGSAAAADAVIFNTQTLQNVSAKQLAQELAPYDVVFFGEYHDQKALHELEAELLQHMRHEFGNQMVLSLEMFEADTQKLLNQYLEGEISEADFLAQSRPWPNYQTDYRPLVEFAKAEKMPVLAANVPRFLAAKLAKEGSLDSVEAQHREYLPLRTYAPEGKYHDKFYAYMQQGQMKFPPERLAQVYAAQCVKDDKMAESIALYLEGNPQSKVLHVNGAFHSDGHLGTAEKVAALNPQLKIAVLAPRDIKEQGKDKEMLPALQESGEYIVYFTREVHTEK